MGRQNLSLGGKGGVVHSKQGVLGGLGLDARVPGGTTLH